MSIVTMDNIKEEIYNFISEIISSFVVSGIPSIMIILICYILIKLTNIFFTKISRKKEKLTTAYFRTFIKVIIIAVGLFQIGNQFTTFQEMSSTIFLSSSLLIAVIGFAFQKSLEDVIAGVMISLFRPFEIGDRISLTLMEVSGWIENITIRHTVVRTFQNSRLIIPNSVMNREVIENSYVVDTVNSGYLDFVVSYKTDLDRAIQIMVDNIKSNESVLDRRTKEQIEAGVQQVKVYINKLHDYGINLRTSIWTQTIEENFQTCSDLRKAIIQQFQEEGIDMPERKIYLRGKLDNE